MYFIFLPGYLCHSFSGSCPTVCKLVIMALLTVSKHKNYFKQNGESCQKHKNKLILIITCHG